VPAWSWYVPLVLMAVVIAAVLAFAHFNKTFMPLVLPLYGLSGVAVMVGAMVGDPQSMEIARSSADRGPNTFEEFMGMAVVVTMIMLIHKARRRGRDGEGAGCDGEGGGDLVDEGGGCDDEGD
jgi:hypothetical protein